MLLKGSLVLKLVDIFFNVILIFNRFFKLILRVQVYEIQCKSALLVVKIVSTVPKAHHLTSVVL